MRMMVTFSFDAGTGNDIVRSGKIKEMFGNLMDDLKPEAVYLHAVNGQRGGHLILDVTDSSAVATIGERFWFGLKADVEMIPVMNPDDLMKGLASLDDIVARYS